jgi:hypothetical protein
MICGPSSSASVGGGGNSPRLVPEPQSSGLGIGGWLSSIAGIVWAGMSCGEELGDGETPPSPGN